MDEFILPDAAKATFFGNQSSAGRAFDLGQKLAFGRRIDKRI